MTMMNSSAHGQAGYTLVEMLVVLALLGLIGLLASGGLTFAGRAQDRFSSETQESRALFAAQQALRRYIGDASVLSANAQDQVAISGGRQEFRFRSAGRGARGADGPVGVALRISQKGQESWIDLTIRALDAGGAEARESYGPLPPGLRIAYGTVDEAGGVEWAPDWTKGYQLPRLVRISAANDKANWPEFIVMVRKNEPPGCRYDPVSRGCR